MDILVAEDCRTYRKIFQKTLTKWGYSVIPVADGKEAWEVFQSHEQPMMAIVDWVMPEMDGLELCRMIRENITHSYVYLMLVTSKDQVENIVEGLNAGADDYITKPFHKHELQMRIRAGQRILDLQSRLISARDELRYQATHDALTQIWNRGAILEMLEGEFDRRARDNSCLSVIMGDIDYFKQINDKHGHLAGDEVLREVSKRISQTIRSYDQIGRYGGEEFIIILPKCDLQTSAEVATRIRHAISDKPISTLVGNLNVSMSMGVATIPDEPLESVLDLVRSADQAMYKAKELGRNQFYQYKNIPIRLSGS